MTRAAGRPLLKALIVAVLVVAITFILGKVVLGNPGRLILGQTATQRAVDAFNQHLGANQPLLEQFERYFGNVLRGQLGQSYAYPGRSVWSLLGPALLTSAVVALTTIVISLLVALPLGVTAAQRKGRVSDHLIRAASVIGLSAPSAFVGVVLIRVIAVDAGALPAGGWGTSPFGDIAYLVLPVATLTFYLSPILVRVVRERAAVVLEEPYVEAATTRGVPRARVIVNHVVPNSIGPLLSVLGYNLGGLLSGSVIADVVFGLPGLGNVLTTAVTHGDLPVIQGVALVSGLVVTLANVVAEIIQRLIDPRLRS